MKRSIELNDKDYQEQTVIGDDVYATADLWNRVKDEEIIEIPIASIEFTEMPWEDVINLFQFCQHYARCQDADMRHPVLLAPHGGIIDGYHRVCRAVIDGDEYIGAKQLKSLPEPISNNKISFRSKNKNED